MTELEQKRIADEIAAFLNKYAGRNTKVEIDNDYMFQIISMHDIDINSNSINQIYDCGFQFNGTAKITRRDPASTVITTSDSYFSGAAFYAEDRENYPILLRASIDNIKDRNLITKN